MVSFMKNTGKWTFYDVTKTWTCTFVTVKSGKYVPLEQTYQVNIYRFFFILDILFLIYVNVILWFSFVIFLKITLKQGKTWLKLYLLLKNGLTDIVYNIFINKYAYIFVWFAKKKIITIWFNGMFFSSHLLQLDSSDPSLQSFISSQTNNVLMCSRLSQVNMTSPNDWVMVDPLFHQLNRLMLSY